MADGGGRKMIYLMRHGESEANVKNLAGTDMPLSEEGHRQAREAVLPEGIVSVCSSTLTRARQTAAIVAGRLGLPLGDPIPEFDEIRWGEYDGRVCDEGFVRDYDTDLPALCKRIGGDDPQERAEAALAALGGLEEGTLVVTSDTLMRCMLGVAMSGRVLPLGTLPYMPNCAVVAFDVVG